MFTPTALTSIRVLREQMKGERFVWALVTPSTLLLISLATYAVASRLMEPAEFGRFAVAMVVLATVVPFASLGGPVILIRHLAGEADEGRVRALRTAVYLMTFLGSGLVLALAFATDVLPGHPMSRWLDVGVAPVVAAGGAATALVDLRVSEDQAAFRFWNRFTTLSMAAVIRLAGLAAVMAVASAPDHRAAIAGYAAGALVSALYVVRSQLVVAFRGIRASLAFLRHDFVRIGLPITASGIVAVLTAQVDTLVAAAYLPAGDVAQYAIANRLAMVHVTVIGGLTAVALPVAATLARRGRLDGYVRVSVRLGLLLGGVAVVLSIALAPMAVDVLFGDVYRPSVKIFWVLSLGFLLNYAGNPLSQVLYMTRRAHLLVLVQVGQLAVFGLAAGFAAFRWGALGLAATRTATNLVAVAAVGVVSVIVARRVAADEDSRDANELAHD